MSWRNAVAVSTLRADLNARYPNRDTHSDGTIGDAAHATRSSDHNPWVVVDGVGVVRAFDADKDGIDADWYAEQIRLLGAAGDPRLNPGGYVIWNRRIAGAHTRWVWHTYTGTNPHTGHVHVSVSTARAGFDSDAHWAFLTGAPAPQPRPRPTPGGPPAFPLPGGHYFGLLTGPARSHGGFYPAERGWVKIIQQALIRKGYVPGVTNQNSGWADGKFEKATADAVTRFQRREMPGTTFYGQVWADDWRKLLG